MASYDDTATVSGSVVSFPNGADDVPTKSLVVTISPTLSPTLSGVSEVTETQTGRTIFYPMDIEQGSISGSGYNSDSIYRIRTAERKAVLPSTEYKIKVNSEVQIYEVHEYTDLTGSSTHLTVNASEYTFTTKSTTNYLKILFRYSNNATITPSAITELQVTDGDFYWKTYTASLGRTIYGGTADIVNGQGTESYGRIIFDGSNDEVWQKHGSIASWFYIDHFFNNAYANNAKDDFILSSWGTQRKYNNVGGLSNGDFSYGENERFVIRNTNFTEVADFKEWLSNNPISIVYKLATPTDFTFDGQEIPTRLGYNAFWSEQGDTELTYYKSGYGFTSVTVNRTGKNLFDKNAVTNNTWIVVNGTATESATGYRTSSYIPVKANTRYYVSTKSSNRSAYYDKNGNGIAYFSFSGGQSFNCLYDGYIRITIKNDIDLDTFVVNEGSEAIPYEPFGISKTAYLHKVIYGGQADVIRGTCEPKNLVDFLSNIEHTYSGFTITTTSDCGINFSGTGTRTWAHLTKNIPCDFEEGTKLVFSVQENKTYNIYVQFTYDDATTQNFTIAGNVVTDNVAFTLPKKAVSVRMDVALLQASTEYNETLYCMIEKGTAKTDYAPFFAPFTFPPISMSTDDGENTLFANEGTSAITYRKAVD